MTSYSLRDRTAALVLGASVAVGFVAFASSLPAFGQAQASEDEAETADATAAAKADDTNPAVTASEQKPTDTAEIDVNTLDWSQLNIDASTLTYGPKAPPRRAEADGEMKWSSNNRANGSAVSVKQQVAPFWDTRVGADMTVTREPTTMSELLAEKTANGGNLPQSGGSAWAAVTAPGAGVVWDKTAVEARVDPSSEQSKLGTSLSKQVPISGQSLLTLQNGYAMTQQGLVAVPGLAARPARTYETDQSAKVSIGDTGTSVTAGQTLSSTDDKWLRKFGAEQKVLDGVTISGSVSETPQGAASKSISAGFKKSW
ncbi:MAG TPA: hypothetical protein VGH70_03785 [Bradyrhizobium sp.]|jgi:hypothetical protein